MKTIISGLIASLLVMGSLSADAGDLQLLPLVPGHAELKSADPHMLGVCGPSHGTVFGLQIWRAFHGEIDFKLCEPQEEGQKFLLVTRDPDADKKVDDRIKVPLTDATYQKLLALYENVRAYNSKDETEGLDGSTWCLEALREPYRKACFWSPAYKSEDRGLTGLTNLGRELWGIAATETRDGPLY